MLQLGNIVDDDNSVYCTRKPTNVTVLLEVKHLKVTMAIVSAVSMSPALTAGTACFQPCILS